MIDLATTTRQFLLPEEFAEILLVSRRTVYNWIKEEYLGSVKVCHSTRIPVFEAKRFLRARFTPPAPVQQTPRPRRLA